MKDRVKLPILICGTLQGAEMGLPGIDALGRNRLAPSKATSFTVDADRHLVIVRLGKKVSFAEIRDYARRLLAHPQFQPNYSEIADLSNVEHLELDANEFIRLADEVDPFAIEAKRAFVVSNSVQAHAARMHKALRTHRNFSIFASMDEAERWITK